MLHQTPIFVCVSCDIAGGLVLACFDECLIAEEIAYGCPAFAVALGASNVGVSQQSI
jgi:alkylation response protein AidB-like acyl-CoA dehydrogenase